MVTPRNIIKSELAEIEDLLQDHWFSDNPNTTEIEKPIKALTKALARAVEELEQQARAELRDLMLERPAQDALADIAKILEGEA